jgi:phosphatidylglycerophosphate synthase
MALDQRVRGLLADPLDALARRLVAAGVTATAMTVIGLLLGLTAAVLTGAGLWIPALAVWLVSRLADGLDGPVARAGDGATDLGGFVDIVADFVAYGAFVVGLGVALPGARVACLVLLLAYYVNGAAFLALSSIAERRRQRVADDGRSLQFVAGLAEGTETITVHAALLLVAAVRPGSVTVLVWGWAAIVGVTVLQRVAEARRHLTG